MRWEKPGQGILGERGRVSKILNARDLDSKSLGWRRLDPKGPDSIFQNEE